VSAPSGFTCEALTPQLAGALSELFVRADSSCFCAYWHFPGDKNAWQARLAFEPEENRRELEARSREPLAGIVASDSEGRAVGWMKLEPAINLAKIYAQRTYRSLAGLTPERERVWTIGCFLVDPAWRRRGVARALLRTGIERARERGARMVEAFPRRAEGVRDEELWTGPYSLFTSEGFHIVHEQQQYPVLRLDL
jgi:GNAT superfamily N-acetyltransferase